MPFLSISRQMRASPNRVFETVADIREFSRAVPRISSYEFLSDRTRGVGTRFRETRTLEGAATRDSELTITEFITDHRVRMVTEDEAGTVWDTVFTVDPTDGGTTLTLTMNATCKRFRTKLFLRAIRGMIQRAVVRDLDFVKTYCER